jgi:hypothetical protein
VADEHTIEALADALDIHHSTQECGFIVDRDTERIHGFLERDDAHWKLHVHVGSSGSFTERTGDDTGQAERWARLEVARALVEWRTRAG